MWLREHFPLLEEPLGFWDVGRLPALDTFWVLLRDLDAGALLDVVNIWLGAWSETERVSIDEKALRGSKREGKAALTVLTAAAQGMGFILKQRGVDEDKTGCALALLEAMPLKGKLVTMDAGLMQRAVVEKIVEKGGPIWGP